MNDLLALQLASLYNGTNVVSGRYEGSRCELPFVHAAGEDVSSTTLTFRQRHGRAVTSSLCCVMTP